MPDFMLVSCEHGGRRIPPALAAAFAGWESILDSHRGFDRGALILARALAQTFAAPLLASTTSRLLIDLNRSLSHPAVWSDVSRKLPEADRREIVRRHYLPYRQRVEDAVRQGIAAGLRVVHVSCHSFTPVLDGQVRSADVGLLYDPVRSSERALVARWKAALNACHQDLRVRRNYPYLGKNDGLTSSLRRLFPAESYVGIEIELNQALLEAGRKKSREVRHALIASLQSVLD